MKLLIFVLLLFFHSRPFAAEQESLSLDKQDLLLKRLESLDQQALKKLRPLPEIEKMDIGKAHKIQAAIIQGAILTDDNGARFYTKKYLYVWGIRRENNPYLFYILNADGEVAFTTHTRYIVPINSDLSMDPTPQVYQEVVPTPNRYTYEKKLQLEVLPQYSLESMSFCSAQSYTGSSGGQTLGQRFGLNLFFPLALPLKPGLFSSYQMGMGSSEQYDYNYSSLDVGPILQFALSKKLSLSISGGKSIFFMANFTQKNGQKQSGSFDATFGGIDANYQLETGWGKFQIGASYKLYTLNAAESTEVISAASRHQQNTVIGINIGMPVEFSL